MFLSFWRYIVLVSVRAVSFARKSARKNAKQVNVRAWHRSKRETAGSLGAIVSWHTNVFQQFPGTCTVYIHLPDLRVKRKQSSCSYPIRGTALKCLANSKLLSRLHYLCLSTNYHCRALSIKREPSTLQFLGILYYHNKQLREAELAWKQALELEPSNVDTRSNYVSTLVLGWYMTVISISHIEKSNVLQDQDDLSNRAPFPCLHSLI